VDDTACLADYSGKQITPNVPTTHTPFVYEGDAAYGWFQANQSAYPTSTAAKGNVFDEVDLRHQIYTDAVNIDKFRDGDRNTAILDLDGSLTGFKVVDKTGMDAPGAAPISLNNLPINNSSNSVDECQAEGVQNTL